jgi:hypothetical protein
LNVGLRWEFERPMFEHYNRSVRGFDTSFVQAFQAAAKAAYNPSLSPLLPPTITTTGGLTFAGVGGQPRGLYNTPKKNLMPRFGFAYQVNDRTVLRGGYGIFYGFLGERRGDVIQSGFSQNTPFIPTVDGINFVGTLSNPFPNGVLTPRGAADGPLTFVGQGITFFDPNPLTPYMQRWQISIQRDVHGFLFDLAYVGNRGTHVDIQANPGACTNGCLTLNTTPRQYLSTSPFRDQATIDALSKNIKNPFFGLLPSSAISGLSGSNIQVNRLLAPYPEFDTVNTSLNNGYSWYHAMQFSIEKRFARGYTLNGSYTYSKYMQANELLNNTDPVPTEVISDLDRPHRVVISGIYEFPFGHGRQFANSVNPVLDRIIGGWQVSGAYVFQSGAPLGNWGNLIYLGNIKDLQLPGNAQNPTTWFNPLRIDKAGSPGNGTEGFVSTSSKALANNIRTFPLRFSFLRGDEASNLDLSIQKKTRITESTQAVFRMDFLNAVNHPVFPAPNLDPTSATFGVITASTQANYPRRIEFGFHFVF